MKHLFCMILISSCILNAMEDGAHLRRTESSEDLSSPRGSSKSTEDPAIITVQALNQQRAHNQNLMVLQNAFKNRTLIIGTTTVSINGVSYLLCKATGTCGKPGTLTLRADEKSIQESQQTLRALGDESEANPPREITIQCIMHTTRGTGLKNPCAQGADCIKISDITGFEKKQYDKPT